jgi:TRAP-type C4-dicarboxylate transport system substrate-binding protein
MEEAPQTDTARVEREEKKIVEETKKAGGTVHEFSPDASPQEKAAATKEVPFQSIGQGLTSLEHAFGLRLEKCRSGDRIGH